MTTKEKITGPEYKDALAKGVLPRDSGPLNIILINADTYRYDNLFQRAALPVATPKLDAFSARAVSMSRFYTGSFPTIPERTDLISGRYNWPWYPWKLLTEANCLPQLLNQHGYVTQLLCDCPHLFNTGFQRVFNAAYQVRGQEGDMPFLRMNEPIREVMPRAKTRAGQHFQDRNLVDLHRWTNRYAQCEDDCFPPRTAALAVRWLEENYAYRPFFLWVDFFDPHEPWDPPEYMVRRYDPDYAGTPMLHPNYGKASDYTAAELRNLRAHYCAEAELVDRWVGRILQKIEDLSLWESSIVVFTTDHGMSLGEHNRTGKSNINPNDDRRWPIYPEVAHIPFLVAGPGLKGGNTVDLLAQPVDIMPTLLDLAGVRAEPPEPLHGRSFATALRGERQSAIHDYVISGSYLRKHDGIIPSTAVTPMIYNETWAYTPIGPHGAPELFDLNADPGAELDIAQHHPEITAAMRAQLLAWLCEMDAPAEAMDALVG